MSALRAVQQQFQDYLLRPERVSGPETVAGASPAERRRRLDIYAEAYRMRLIEVLEGDFPAVKGALGESAFARVASRYVAGHPSRSPSLRWYGRDFPAFLLDDAAPRSEAIAELARFEWLQGEVFDAPDAEALPAQALGEVPPERWPGLVLEPHPAVQRVRFEYATPRTWSAVMAGDGAPFETAPADWLLWRAGLDVHWRSLGPDESWAFEAMCGSVPFEALCAGLCRWHDGDAAAEAAVSMLARWLADGVIRAIRS